MYREEWHAKYVEGDGKHWESIGDEHIEFSSSYAYWNSKKDTWDVLSRVARWWCATPLGAILAERTFALGRVINTASRQSMSWDTFTQELHSSSSKRLSIVCCLTNFVRRSVGKVVA